jgi:ketosteroid isomerase-like protein
MSSVTEPSTDQRHMEEIVERYGAAWNAHDVDTLMSMQTDDMVFHLHLQDVDEVVGAEALREQFSAFFRMMPDYHAEITRTTVRGDLAVLEYTITATLAEPFPLGKVTGKAGRHASFESMDILRFSGDKVARKDTYLDGFAMRAGWDI